MLSLLGRFGGPADGEIARRFLDHPDDRTANVAYETWLRLADPLLVPDQWREL